MSHHKEVSNDDCLRMFQQYVLLHYIMLLHEYSSIFESGNSYIRECELIFEGKKRHDKHSYLLLTTTLSYSKLYLHMDLHYLVQLDPSDHFHQFFAHFCLRF